MKIYNAIKFLSTSFLLILLILLATRTQAQDWPRFRGDLALSGRTITKTPANNIPNNFIEFQLGGSAIQPLIADINNDSQPEIIYLQQGRLIINTQSGITLLNKFFGITDLVAITDLDNDGSSPEIIAIDTFQRILLVINADGNIRWQRQFPEFVTLSSTYIKIADISPERPGKEIVVFPDHTKTQLDAAGYFFSSQGTLYANPVVPQLFGGQLNFPEIAIADIDNDGAQEVVVVGRPRLMIFSGNGELKQQLDFREGDPEGRHYGLLNLADVNGDGMLEAVIIADDIPSLPDNGKVVAMSVFQLTPTIKRLWGTTFPLPQVIRAPLNAVQDFDKDGHSEIVLNVWTGDEQQIRIYRGEGDPVNLGQPMMLATIRGAYVWDLQDLNNDGSIEFLSSLETVAVPNLTVNSDLKIYRPTVINNSYSFADSGDPIKAMYLLTRPSISTSDFSRAGSSDEARNKALILDTPLPRFLTYSSGIDGTTFQERFLSTDSTSGQDILRVQTDLDIQRPGVIRAVLSNVLNGEKFLINRETNGQLIGELSVYQRVKTRLRILGAPAVIGSSFSTQARVADIDADKANEILVKAPSGQIVVLSLNEQTNNLIAVASFVGNSTPIIQALSIVGKKNRPQIITTTNDNGRLRLVVYDSRGSVTAKNLQIVERWGVTFPDIPANTDVEITTGRFGGLSNRVDIFLSTPRGRSLVLSGADGTILWTRPDVFVFGNHASVRDFNGDGKDDIYLVSNNLYRIIDGATGNTLVGPINIGNLGSDFFATPILSGNGEVLLVGPGSVVKITDLGRPVWNFSKTINGKAAQRQATNILMGIAETGNGGSFDLVGGNFGENDSFYIYSYFTGLLTTKTPYQPITDIISIDLNSDNQDEFIFGTADGQIIAIKAQDGSLLWSIPLDSFVGDPIVASVGKSKKTSLIFTPGNGTLRLYQLN